MLVISDVLLPTVQNYNAEAEALYRGLDSFYDYPGRRPIQCFSIKLSYPVYVLFRDLNLSLRGDAGKPLDEERRIQSFTVKLPFPLYLQFKKQIKSLRARLPAEQKRRCTMTAWVSVAIPKLIVPAMLALVERVNTDESFLDEVRQHKEKYTMTSWVAASVGHNILPAIERAIEQVQIAA